jgi:hypothetical protein
MHFHLPKPLHGWREFAGEVGIIVVGVLIALAAEQVVEDWSWKNRVHQAEASMEKEIADDDGPQAYERLAMRPCIARELDQAEQALIAERDSGSPFVPQPLTAPPFRTWDENSWLAAVSSQATSHMPTKRMYDWSAPFSLIPDMNQASLRETQDWAELERIGTVAKHPSEAQRERIMAALARARQDNELLTFLARFFVHYASAAGVTVPNAERLAAVRRLPSALRDC